MMTYNKTTVTCLISFVIVVVSASLLALHSAGADDEKTPPFTWDDTFASPGTSLTITESTRMQMGKTTIVNYEIRADGFSSEEEYLLWRKIGTVYARMPVTLTAEGLVQLLPGVDGLMVGGFARGEALDIALISQASDRRAQAKTIPFPIEVQGEGGCSASAELQSKSGLLFLITFAGFRPGETVHVTSRYKKENIEADIEASDHGQVQLPVLFGKKDRKTATAIATGKNCRVSLDYKVGKDAQSIQ